MNFPSEPKNLLSDRLDLALIFICVLTFELFIKTRHVLLADALNITLL